MLEIIIQYIIIILPSFVTIFGALISSALSSHRVKKSFNDAQHISKEALAAINQVKDSNDFKELYRLLKEEKKARLALEKSLTLAYEEIRRIHEAHPEWIEANSTDAAEEE